MAGAPANRVVHVARLRVDGVERHQTLVVDGARPDVALVRGVDHRRRIGPLVHEVGVRPPQQIDHRRACRQARRAAASSAPGAAAAAPTAARCPPRRPLRQRHPCRRDRLHRPPPQFPRRCRPCPPRRPRPPSQLSRPRRPNRRHRPNPPPSRSPPRRRRPPRHRHRRRPQSRPPRPRPRSSPSPPRSRRRRRAARAAGAAPVPAAPGVPPGELPPPQAAIDASASAAKTPWIRFEPVKADAPRPMYVLKGRDLRSRSTESFEAQVVDEQAARVVDQRRSTAEVAGPDDEEHLVGRVGRQRGLEDGDRAGVGRLSPDRDRL